MVSVLLYILILLGVNKEEDIMTVYESLMLMIAFAAFVISFINIKR